MSNLRWTTANLDFVRGHDREYLAHLCADADVLLVQEAKTVHLADVLPEGWGALQDTSSEARMGSAICYRKATVSAAPLMLRLGSLPTLGLFRARMLTRYIACAHLFNKHAGPGEQSHYFAVSAHFPPERYRVLQPLMERRLKRVLSHHQNAVVGLDANQPVDQLAKRLGLGEFSHGIVGLIVGPNVVMPATSQHIDHWGKQHGYTDHPSISATVTHKEKP